MRARASPSFVFLQRSACPFPVTDLCPEGRARGEPTTRSVLHDFLRTEPLTSCVPSPPSLASPPSPSGNLLQAFSSSKSTAPPVSYQSPSPSSSHNRTSTPAAPSVSTHPHSPTAVRTNSGGNDHDSDTRSVMSQSSASGPPPPPSSMVGSSVNGAAVDAERMTQDSFARRCEWIRYLQEAHEGSAHPALPLSLIGAELVLPEFEQDSLLCGNVLNPSRGAGAVPGSSKDEGQVGPRSAFLSRSSSTVGSETYAEAETRKLTL